MRYVVGSILVMLVAAAASRSVWDGVYSKEQAGRGQTAYNSKCARCHGESLMGGEDSPALVDRDFLEKWNGKSVGSLVEVIRKTMPSDGPGKLTPPAMYGYRGVPAQCQRLSRREERSAGRPGRSE